MTLLAYPFRSLFPILRHVSSILTECAPNLRRFGTDGTLLVMPKSVLAVCVLGRPQWTLVRPEIGSSHSKHALLHHARLASEAGDRCHVGILGEIWTSASTVLRIS